VIYPLQRAGAPELPPESAVAGAKPDAGEKVETGGEE
jgi:hypothetical protein